jgi:excisionase family DNA binding protein
MSDHKPPVEHGERIIHTEWMTTEEIAALFRVSVFTVRRAVRAGRLRTREVMPGLIRIDPRSVPTGRGSREGGW